MAKDVNHITILGGGPAGLAMAFYAHKTKLPLTLYEAQAQVGGTCQTFKFEGFRYDSGAHRFHDKNPRITKEVVSLMGKDLKKIYVPTQIYQNGKFIDFPLRPINLFKHLGPITFIKAGFEVVFNQLFSSRQKRSFADFAITTYGQTIANLLLLKYSARLWGRPCQQLSLSIGGKRFKGLNLKSFLTEALLGEKARIEHLEGASFYYPDLGIGMIMDRLIQDIDQKDIKTKSKITKIFHNGKKIEAIEINGKTKTPVDQLVSSLPISYFLQIMDPKPPKAILELAQDLQFRDMILVAVFINKASITKSATVYFHDKDYLFTRIYEPRNRSGFMSPKGKTSLVAEIPCQKGDSYWQTDDQELVDQVVKKLIKAGWLKKENIIATQVKRMEATYPILELGYEQKVAQVNEYLKRFPNLYLTGRNGKFVYSWIHNMMEYAQEIIAQIKPQAK
ncbi:NAD(P)-binding protein [Candidatus Beckwithbacteria bacterium]|nr:NAD(P)-binding protein [Candidatus Beckwithbacteria bacterium]